MKSLELIRSYLPDRTIGFFEGFKTLERPWKNNKRNESCIPEGTYRVNRDNFGKYRYYRVENVTGRTAIEFHGGVVPTHSDGCVLLGTHFTSSYDLAGSDKAFEQLMEHTTEEDFQLTIRSFNPAKDYELIS